MKRHDYGITRANVDISAKTLRVGVLVQLTMKLVFTATAFIVGSAGLIAAFSPREPRINGRFVRSKSFFSGDKLPRHDVRVSLSSEDAGWKGEIVSNDSNGRIRGCSIERKGDSMTEWKVTVDG